MVSTGNVWMFDTEVLFQLRSENRRKQVFIKRVADVAVVVVG